ncbi:rhodanese-like domain-containing protein [Zhongshania arctica]|uniref:Rhodanese-like domain-containing protein n=1 Tax=Zhongshania arctica TaxID=3238302 RepID=A0ABV3TUI0_9GAMM
MTLNISSKQLVQEASAKIKTLSLEEAKLLLGKPDVQFVDIRDVRELQQEGTIPGAFHAPRGMLEFWVDPDSPYFKPVFGEAKQFVFFCRSASRSALASAALQDMGLKNVAHIAGGYSAWKESGGDIATPEKSL